MDEIFTVIKRVIALSLVVYLSMASVLLSETEKPVQLLTYGEPPEYRFFLEKFDLQNDSFVLSEDFVAVAEADYIVAFMDSRSNGDFLPTALHPLFEMLVSRSKGYSFKIDKSIFGGTLKADVLIFIRDEAENRLRIKEATLDKMSRNAILDCIFAHKTSEKLSKNTKKFDDIYTICKALKNE